MVITIGEGNVALYAAPNPFLCTLYLNKICLNQPLLHLIQVEFK